MISVYYPQDVPAVLFLSIKDCQEVQILVEDPYTAQQLLNNAVWLLLQCGIYKHYFEDWDRKTAADMIWTNLKTFVQECYTHRLNATSITAGSQGYVQNVFAALGEESEDDDDDVQTVITLMAVLTTQSQLTANTTAETHDSVMAAINQLTANQHVMQQQFAAFTTQRNTTYQPPQPPPIMQFTIPNYTMFPTIGCSGGDRGGGCGWGRRATLASTGGLNKQTPFVNLMGQGGQSEISPIGVSGRQGDSIAPFAQQTPTHNAAPM